MTDRPIIFSGPMVRALLDGRKTQTRRILKPQPPLGRVVPCDDRPGWFGDEEGEWNFFAGYAPGDRLYVRETFYQFGHWEPIPGKVTKGGRQKWRFVTLERDEVLFAPPPGLPLRLGRHHKDPSTPAWHKRLGRFMPRKFSRLTLIVEAEKVERLQGISEADAKAEGAPALTMDDDGKFYESERGTHYCGFAGIWSHINGAASWDANPWVVAVSFRVERANIDAREAA